MFLVCNYSSFKQYCELCLWCLQVEIILGTNLVNWYQAPLSSLSVVHESPCRRLSVAYTLDCLQHSNCVNVRLTSFTLSDASYAWNFTNQTYTYSSESCISLFSASSRSSNSSWLDSFERKASSVLWADWASMLLAWSRACTKSNLLLIC